MVSKPWSARAVNAPLKSPLAPASSPMPPSASPTWASNQPIASIRSPATMHEMSVNLQNMVESARVQSRRVGESTTSVEEMAASIDCIAETAGRLLQLCDRPARKPPAVWTPCSVPKSASIASSP